MDFLVNAYGIFYFFLFGTFLGWFSSNCQAATYIVDPSGLADFEDIQSAIDSVSPGDEIVVQPGIYASGTPEGIDFKGKTITVRSTDPDDPNIVNGTIIFNWGSSASPKRGFIFQTNETVNSVLRGITIAAGYSPDTELEPGNIQPSGGAIFIRNASPTLDRCLIWQNEGGLAAGIFVFGDQAAPVIEHCTFRENTGGSGAALWSSGGAQPILRDCDFLDNHANGYGGAVVLWSPGQHAILERCYFSGNYAGSDGGAIYTYACYDRVTVRDCLFTGNQSYYGGVFYCYDRSNPIIQNCTLAGNIAEMGGAICCYRDSDPSVTNCILWNNDASQGSQIALRSEMGATSIAISFSDIQGGKKGVFAESGSSLIWGKGNMDTDPTFVQEGIWDDSGTPQDFSDDVWIDGDYHLTAGSLVVEKGDPNFVAAVNETDFEGNNRIHYAFADMGAYEYTGLILNKFTLKAGKIRPAGGIAYDSFSLTGRSECSTDDLAAADSILLQIGPWSHTIDTHSALFKQSGSNPKYTYKYSGDEIVAMTLDFSKGSFTAVGKNVDFSGIQAPVDITLSAGPFSQTASASEVIANGVKPVPVQLLVGVENALRVTKCKFTAGPAGGNSDSLSVEGELAVQNTSADMTSSGVTITWGTYSVTIPPSNLVRVGDKWSFKYQKPQSTAIAVSSASFDLEKCTFKIAIKNDAIGNQGSPVSFGLTFGSFNQSVDVAP